MKTPAEWKTLFESSAFARQTNYSGPLGPEYNPSGTRLRLWAPTAQKVSVNLYRRGDGGACMGTLPLEQHGQGVWSVYLPGDQHGHYYTFTVEVDGTAYETGDPYARTAGVNGLRSMILDAPRIDPPDWNHDHRVIVPASRRTVWEVSVRDFSQDPACGVRNAWRGKFMAFTQKGTTLSSAGTFPTCLDYLKRLGVGYVQLLPIFDFGSVDESRPLTRQYNWGYDPTNYNVPEGSYSTDPTKGEVRVRECKEMIASLHAAGIGVIMDVVYNHVYNAANHSFNKTVPGYYFRYDANGSLVNNSGCGNDTASERKMMRKYIVDSVTYWAKNYNIDGFRFDLMGLIDTKTMQEVRAALDKIDTSIIVLGEGWDMNSTMDKSEMTIQPNAYQVASDGTNNGIAFFNDSIRDGLKGSVFSDTDTGFVSGKADQESLIAHNVLGCQYDADAITTCWNGNAQYHYADAGQVVNYAEIRDNMTLYDKLRKSVPTDDEATTEARAKLADSVVYLSEGIPAIQLGQEFLRTKGGNDNSYNAGDEVNAIDWDRTTQYSGSVDYVRGLIKLRNRIAALRQTSYSDINASVTMLKSANGVVAYQAKDSSGTYVVIFNANNDAAAIDGVEAGKYEVLADDGTVYGDDDVKSVTVRKGSAYTAGALSATVLKVASADDVVPVISGVNESTTITVGSKFDPMAGVSATDDIDGDLTDKIKVEGTVDANKVGDYKLVYSVTNSRGKTTTFTRTVHVQKQAVTPAADKNNGNANGKINGKADNTKEDAEKSAAQSPATGSNVAGIALAVMVLAVAAGVLVVLRRKEAGDR